MTDASGTTTYGYDDHDRLATKATPQGTLSYTYDPAGNVATMQSSNANGVSVAYTYDSLNRLATVVDNRLPAGANTTTYSYDPASNLATVTYPNGLQSTFTYDDLNRVTALNNGKASYTYTLGPTGSRQSATESSGRTLNWSYDGIYRLTNETITLDPMSKNGTVAYGLDPVGNRLSQTSSIPGIPTASFLYDFDDRIQPPTESYDPNGNTLVSGSRTFAYDFENRLKSMNGGAVTLVYDGDGNRVAKTAGGVTTRYLVDDLNPTGYAQVVEEIGAGGVQRTYTYGLRRINQNQLANSTWTPSFYGYDALGSVRQLTSSTGAVTDTYDFDAWGNAVNTTGSTPNVYLYQGEQYDPDLNLYYLRARYFNPLTGRFLTRDAYDGNLKDTASLHKYLYAGADPVNHSDPTGNEGIGIAATRPCGGDMGEYAMLSATVAIGVGAGVFTMAATQACMLTYYMSMVGFDLPDVGRLNICKACDPPVGTECTEYDINRKDTNRRGDHKGWDVHYHLWKRGMKPDRTCTWDRINDKSREYPHPGLLSCYMYSSWILWKFSHPK